MGAWMSEYLYHVTSIAAAAQALEEGLPTSATLLRADVAKFYAQQMECAGQRPAVIRVPGTRVMNKLRPDGLAIICPSDNGLTASDSAVFDAWANSEGTAEDSLAIVGSARCAAQLSAEHLRSVSVTSLEADIAPREIGAAKGGSRDAVLSWLRPMRAARVHLGALLRPAALASRILRRSPGRRHQDLWLRMS